MTKAESAFLQYVHEQRYIDEIGAELLGLQSLESNIEHWKKIEKAVRKMEERGGSCIGVQKGERGEVFLQFRCREGHTFTRCHLQRLGTWCPECHISSPITIQELHAVARSRGGICLNLRYVPKRKTQWSCSDGHIWEADARNVLSGSWCPTCSTGTRENLCRDVFEYIFSTEFERDRPDWLQGDLGWPLELDGYSSSLQIAFEHQGKQHYEQVPHFQPDITMLERRKAYDEYKRMRCQQRGILLVEIPYWVATESVPQFIFEYCTSHERAPIRDLSRFRSIHARASRVRA